MREAILRMILYFDVFKHPLTLEEIERLVAPGRRDDVLDATRQLVSDGLITIDGRYAFRPGQQRTVQRRQRRARSAERLWPKACAAAGLLARLPFVRGVFITGSLSKRAVTENADVDFLLLVAPERVWSIKTITQLSRKILPEPIRELFCTNYILSVDALALSDQNLFTAVELSTAVPMYGPDACTAFIDANPWASRFVPGLCWAHQRAQNARQMPAVTGRAPFEALWSDTLARRTEQTALSLWDRYWNRKYDWLARDVRAQRFRRSQSTATNHLHDFQDYVLREVQARLDEVALQEPVRI
ncbi:MAG: hypothetical protein AAFV53_17340 [Myxococcota bacterium]